MAHMRIITTQIVIVAMMTMVEVMATVIRLTADFKYCGANAPQYFLKPLSLIGIKIGYPTFAQET